MRKKNQLYLELIDNMRAVDVLPGAAELIRALNGAGIKLGLGSSSKNAQLLLENLGLSDLFQVVVDGNHITLSKPDPEVFLKGAQALGVRPSECMVFEDAASGIRAAKTGGFFAVGLGHPVELEGADKVLPGLHGVQVNTLRGWMVGA
jgi:beta-phosphoglucomutase